MRMFPRLALAAVLVLLASGIPGAAVAALDVDCCEGSCERGPDGNDCPPNCTGPCASSATLLAAGCVSSRQRVRRVPAKTDVAAPALPLVMSSVFQPPKI